MKRSDTSQRSSRTPLKPVSICSDSIANAEWDRICQQLAAKDRLENHISGSLSAICETFSRVKALIHYVNRKGRTYRSGRRTCLTPMVQELADTLDVYLSTCRLWEIHPAQEVALHSVSPTQEAS